MLILALLVFGIFVGGIAQLILGTPMREINWGFAIILLTILVRGAMFPLNFRMQKSMRAYGAKMAKLKPQLAIYLHSAPSDWLMMRNSVS